MNTKLQQYCLYHINNSTRYFVKDRREVVVALKKEVSRSSSRVAGGGLYAKHRYPLQQRGSESKCCGLTPTKAVPDLNQIPPKDGCSPHHGHGAVHSYKCYKLVETHHLIWSRLAPTRNVKHWLSLSVYSAQLNIY